jgi:hypothetical protein
MTDGDDINDLFDIIHRIQNTVIPYTDPPEILRTLELSAPGGTRILFEPFYSQKDSGTERLFETFEFVSG